VLNPGALTCGANPGSPVTGDYASPFKLTAAIHRRNGGRQRRADPLNEAELRVHMSRQQATGGAIPRNTPEWSIGRRQRPRQSLSHHQRIGDLIAC
jgi:hypothetical protein